MGTFVTFVLITAPGDAALSGVGLQGRHLATLQKSETNGGVSCFLVGEPVCWFCPLVPGLTGPARRPRPGADGCTGEGAPRTLLPKVTCVFLPPPTQFSVLLHTPCLPPRQDLSVWDREGWQVLGSVSRLLSQRARLVCWIQGLRGVFTAGRGRRARRPRQSRWQGSQA